MVDLTPVVTLRDEIDRLRARIVAEQQIIVDLRDAPMNSRDATAALEDYIERRASDYEALATAHAFLAPTPGAGALLPSGSDPEAFACYFFADVIRTKLKASFAGLCSPSLDRAARRPLLREAQARLLDLEREEEALIVRALEAGIPILRRGDADPRAVLNITD